MDRDAQCRTSEEMTLRMVQPNRTDEAAIIEAILAGNSELFHDLIRPHEQSAYRMALSATKSVEADRFLDLPREFDRRRIHSGVEIPSGSRG